MAPIFRYNLTLSTLITHVHPPSPSPRDRHSNEDKGPKSPRLRLDSIEIAKLNTQLASLSEQISKRNDKIKNYRSLHAEHMTSIQHNITPYIRRQLELDAAGRGIQKGSPYQMHLMMNLRIRVQFLRDRIDQMTAENASDEEKIGQLEKMLGIEKNDIQNGEDDA
ncbi:hypothetical protein KCU81_g4800, partial [Aureobasidium melanogenum]|uniref:Uncharacterized protein n=1 Tax=Aureobasidium melanogenum (strain CBS 110374) TaxID=1043003 RepID=A0A074VG51_AURM1